MFDGVKIDGPLSSKISQYRAKGYSLVKIFPEGRGASFKGNIAGRPIELLIFTTEKTKVVFKAIVYLPKQQTWDDIKYEYSKFVDVFTQKMGEPDNQFSFFRDPYFEGDDFEMQAVALEKVEYSSFWVNRNNTTIALSISKYKQVEIVYENDRNMELAKRESLNVSIERF
jgi:hypothetical protein